MASGVRHLLVSHGDFVPRYAATCLSGTVTALGVNYLVIAKILPPYLYELFSSEISM